MQTYRYTGEYTYMDDLTIEQTEGFGLMFYNARWYDPYLNHFTQPDSIVPDTYNSQDWNRYAYAANNPIRYNDPTGHNWEDCGGRNGYGCNIHMNHVARAKAQWAQDGLEKERRKQDRLFALMFMGSGENGAWTSSDWDYYYAHRDDLWSNPDTWINPDQAEGWDLFALHVQRLASHYGSDEKDQFVRDFALVFAGTPTDESFLAAAMEVSHGPVLPMLNYTNDGLNSKYLDSIKPWDNQSHHYAGIFFLSYFATPIVAHAANFGRDYDNVGDINLGNAALIDAWKFRQSTSTGWSILTDMISALK